MRGVNSSLRMLVVAAAVLVCSTTGFAGVTTSTDLHSFVVEGSTASEIVRYMNRNAFEGDSGRAYANMHPNYSIAMRTRQVGAMCRPATVNIHIELSLTLPFADTSMMGKGTRPLWNNFLAFTRAHESHHRVTYLGCAYALAAKLLRQSAPSCDELQWTAQQMLAEMASACEASEQPFERSQARVLPNLALFRAARAGR